MTRAGAYASVGFLYHPPSRMVLLHHRDANASHYPLCWAGFGGMDEPDDGDDPAVTFQREMHEELGVVLRREQIIYLRSYINEDVGRQRHVFYAVWPSTDDTFALTEGDGYRWFTLEDALRLPDLMSYARDDLRCFRETVLDAPLSGRQPPGEPPLG